MGVMKRGKRKIIVNEQVYWWFVDNDSWGEPLANIIADNHSLIANCNLYCPVLKIIKDSAKGRRNIPVPDSIANENFTPQFIAQLIHLSLS